MDLVAGLARRGRRFVPAASVGLLALFTAAAGLAAAVAGGSTVPPRGPEAVYHRVGSTPRTAYGNRLVGLHHASVRLPAATAPPQAAPAALLDTAPVAPREDFAFAPYWTLPQSGGFDLTGLTTLAYFSIDVNPDGTLDESSPGWNGYQSQALADLVTRAHDAGERVVLTVTDFDQGSLDSLTSSASAPQTLAAALIPALQAKNLDGVNFDFEGEGNGDQAGLTNLISSVAGSLRAADPHWQITMDTYASSAGDPGGFYNIAALAPSVDAFFVMAYDLNLQGTPGANSPLTSGQFSDLTALEQYTAAVSPSKVIVGTPFYGMDWPTSDGTLQAQAMGDATDVADSDVQDSTHPAYWDPVTDTGWTSYQNPDGQWHESFWDSPSALYMVSEMATQYGVRGVGIWALGMEDDDTQMIGALDGTAPAGGSGGSGPASTSASPTTTVPSAPTAPIAAPTTPGAVPGVSAPGPGPTGASSPQTTAPAPTTTTAPAPFITGTAGGRTVDLTPVDANAVNPLLPIGSLTNFATNNPAYACLVGGPPLTYYSSLSGSYDVVEASTTNLQPDCMTQDFVFPT